MSNAIAANPVAHCARSNPARSGSGYLPVSNLRRPLDLGMARSLSMAGLSASAASF
jgi:hypothetical protein